MSVSRTRGHTGKRSAAGDVDRDAVGVEVGVEVGVGVEADVGEDDDEEGVAADDVWSTGVDTAGAEDTKDDDAAPVGVRDPTAVVEQPVTTADAASTAATSRRRAGRRNLQRRPACFLIGRGMDVPPIGPVSMVPVPDGVAQRCGAIEALTSLAVPPRIRHAR